jgi:hypothetical protein
LLQTAAGVRLPESIGLGFIVAVTMAFPEHPPAFMVYKYATATSAADVFSSTSLIFPVPVFALLLIPATTALDQVKLVPVTELTGV